MENSQNLLEKEGILIDVTGNKPLLLHDRESIWVVHSGRVDVFVVRVEDGEAVGARSHLFRAETGHALFGVEANHFALLASGSTGTRLLRLERSRLQELAKEHTYRPQIVSLIDNWVNGLSLGIVQEVAPILFTPLSAKQEVSLSQNGIARPKAGVLWVRHLEGHSHFLGHQTLSALNEAHFFPLSSQTWLQAGSKNKLYGIQTESLIAEDPKWLCLQNFHECALACLLLNLERQAKNEQKRLQLKSSADELYMANAFTRLESTFGRASASLFLAEDMSDDLLDPLVIACRQVGQALEIQIQPRPDPIDGKVEIQTLDGIVRASRIRMRKVALRDEWWRKDNGPLLAYVEENQRPVALIPTSAPSYQLRDPVEQQITPLTPELAATLSPFAFTFYRTFPKRLTGGWDLIKFGLQGNNGDLITILLMGVATGLLALVTPLATGIIFDSLIPSAARSPLLQLSLGLMVVAFATAAFQVTQHIAVLRLEGKMDTELQAAMWDRLLSLPVPFFRDYSAGDLAIRAMGINRIRQTITGSTLSSLLQAIFSLFSFALLFYIDARLAFVASGLLLIYLFLTALTGLLEVRYQREVTQLEGQISGLVLQLISGLSKVRAAGAETRAFARWADYFSDQKKLAFRARLLANRIAVQNAIFPVFASMAIFAMIAFSNGTNLTTGEFLAFNAAFTQFMVAMLAVTSGFTSLFLVLPTYERAKPILQALPEVDQAKADPGKLTGQIEISHLTFRYQADGPQILKHINLRIQAGEFVALVGPSGSGKSTLFRLLLGFETPELGAVYYNGHDLAGLDIRQVRRQIGVVLQDGQLMPGDILSNIIGSSANLTIDDAWEAARMAGIEQDIKQMPMGMHTFLTEGANTLSGGQRQRLLIARAIVKKPKILFFDEATSALDNRTQSIVSESLENLQATRIVIAHRLSTIINADRIFVLDKGQIIQQGTYDELTKQEGVFADLVKRQLA